MKTVKSAADLKALALQRGASVSIGGEVFNASGQRLAVVPQARKPTPAPAAPAKVDPPAPAAVDITPLADSLRESTQANAAALAQMGESLAKALGAQPLARVWNFKVAYDTHGRITNIKATADN